MKLKTTRYSNQRIHRKETSTFAQERYKINAPLPSIPLWELERMAARDHERRQPQLIWDAFRMCYRWSMA